MQVEQVLFHFKAKLESLKDWPDKLIIMELTAFTEASIAIAPHFVNIIVEKLINLKTNSAYKLPLFYLVDSIMKHVGGPYAALFGKLFSEVYTNALHDINEKDCPKLDFLLNTWDERKLLPKDLIFNMKSHLGNRSIPQISMNQPIARPTPSFGGRSNPTNTYNGKPSGIPPPKDNSFSPQAIYADLVNSEMVNFLNQLYREMNITDPPTLHELSDANPELFEKIRLQAEENANALLSIRQSQSMGAPVVRGDQASSSGVHIPYLSSHVQKPQALYSYQALPEDTSRITPKLYDEQQQLGIQMKVQRQIQNIEQQMQTNPKIQKPTQNFGDDGYMKKRRMDYAGTGVAGAPVPGMGGGGWKKQVPPQQYQQQQHQYVSRYTGREGPPAPGFPGRGRVPDTGFSYDKEKERGVFRDRDRDRDMPVAKAGVPTSQDKGDPIAAGGSDPLDSNYDESAAKLLQARLFVNGFVCETPVVVDIDRVSTLLQRLKHLHQGVDVPVKAFDKASDVMTKRLQSLFEEVNIPPALPPILFGPLPLEPLIAKKLDNRGASATAQSVDKNKAAAKKLLPIPTFRVEELGRNPEPMLRALYSDRSHQFHEDGLRFKTLALLQEHTNAFLERKKLLLKKKDNNTVRECREWYCSINQWITDFNRLSVSSALASGEVGKDQAGQSGHSGDGEMQQAPEEEFIVPADEHFTRCPISREVFEAFFDEEEGEFMYRNAAKLLVTESADAGLFKLGRATENKNSHEGDIVRYLIVHKLLVLDNWLQSGKATSLSEALQRYQAAGTKVPAAIEAANRLKAAVAAAGDEEDEDDVFVVLDLFS